MSLIRKHGAVLQAWACLDLVYLVGISSASDYQLVFATRWQRFMLLVSSLFQSIVYCESSVCLISMVVSVSSVFSG